MSNQSASPSKVSQAKYIAGLVWILRKTNWTKYEKECYIISARWFDKWAAYVDFPKYSSKGNLTPLYYTTPSGDDINFGTGKEHPGAIDNQYLLAEAKEYYHNFSYLQDKCNFVFRDGLEENRDYYVVTKDIWDYLHSIYGGLALSRDCMYAGVNGRMKIDIKMEKVCFSS